MYSAQPAIYIRLVGTNTCFFYVICEKGSQLEILLFLYCCIQKGTGKYATEEKQKKKGKRNML